MNRIKDGQMRKKKPISKANTYGVDPEVDLGVKIGADDQPDVHVKQPKRPSKGKKTPKVVPSSSTATSDKPKKVKWSFFKHFPEMSCSLPIQYIPTKVD